MINDIGQVLVTEEQIKEKVAEIGAQITKDYADKNLLIISVLKGSVVFMADLMREIKIPARIDFMAVSSYGSGTTSSGTVKILKDLDVPVDGYDVLVVEDILDSGLTLSHIFDLLKSRNAKSIRLCTFLNKPDRRKVDITVDYEAFKIPDEFVVGYGLDYDEKYRNLPFVGILKPEIYE